MSMSLIVAAGRVRVRGKVSDSRVTTDGVNDREGVRVVRPDYGVRPVTLSGKHLLFVERVDP